MAVASEDAAHRLEEELSHQQDDPSFIPHCVIGAEVETETPPVVITHPGADTSVHRDMLMTTIPEVSAEARSLDQCLFVTSVQLSAALAEMEKQGHMVKRFEPSRRR